jgi:multiple sugar transport system substrate-binding protein
MGGPGGSIESPPMRKTLLVVRAGLIASILAGASCSGESPSAPGGGGTSAGPVQLKMAWWGGMERANRTRAVVAMFEAQNPNVKVETEFYMSTQGMGIPGTDYWPTVNKYAGDGTLPDIIQQDYAYLEEWHGRKLLRPLDDYLADGTVKLNDVPKAFVDGGKVGNDLVAISLGINTQVIVVDTDVLAKHNIAVPGDDWTWEDFERIALEIKAKEGIFGAGAGMWGYTPGWKAIYLSLDKWVFSADGKALGYTDDQPWIDHYKMLLRLKAAGAIPTLAQEPTSPAPEMQLTVTKKAAMEHVFSNQVVGLWTAADKANGDVHRNFKVLPLPRVKGGKSPIYMKPSQYFSVTTASKHPKEAAKLIEFFTNDIEANKILKGERGVPINSKVLAAVKTVSDQITADSFGIIERGAAFATKLPPNDPPTWTPLLNTILTPTGKAIMDEMVTPEAGVAQFRTKATAHLAGQPAQ